MNLDPQNFNLNNTFATSLVEIDDALRTGKHIGFRHSENGEVEAYAYSNWEFWKWTIWGENQEKLKKKFGDTALKILDNQNPPKEGIALSKKVIIDVLKRAQIVSSQILETISPIKNVSFEAGVRPPPQASPEAPKAPHTAELKTEPKAQDKVLPKENLKQENLDEPPSIQSVTPQSVTPQFVIPQSVVPPPPLIRIPNFEKPDEVKEAIGESLKKFYYIEDKLKDHPEQISYRDLQKILEYQFLKHFDPKAEHTHFEYIAKVYGKVKNHLSGTRHQDHIQALEYEMNSNFLLALKNNQKEMEIILERDPVYLIDLSKSVISTLNSLTSSHHLADSSSSEDPRLLISNDHLLLLDFILESKLLDEDVDLRESAQKVKEKIDSIFKEVTKYLAEYDSLFNKLKLIDEGTGDRFRILTETEIKQALLDIEQHLGKTFALSTLTSNSQIPKGLREGLKNLLTFENRFYSVKGTVDFTRAQPIKEKLKANHAQHSNIGEKIETGKETLRKFKEYFTPEGRCLKPLTIFDAKPIAEFELYLSTYGDPTNPEVKKLLQDLYKVHQNLEKHFQDTHQRGGFYEIEVPIRSDFLFTLMDDEEAFAKLVKKNPFIEFLCEDVLSNIYEKATHDPSVHGHPREILTLDDLRALSVMRQHFSQDPTMSNMIEASENSINHKLVDAKNQLTQYKDFFRKLDEMSPDKMASFLKKMGEVEESLAKIPPDRRQEALANDIALNTQLQLVLEARRVILDIDLQAGRYFDDSVLSSLSSDLGLEKARQLDQLRGSTIDMAQLVSIKEAHDKFPHHPRVAIEGGGPTGLLLALTQYEGGADVSLFEKRSGLYERSQIVRLDPKWMGMLKYYLGEEYYKTFVDENHKGIIREDGFGEITTMDLEAILNIRLIELKSTLNPQEASGLETFAAHELVEIKSPEKPEEKFKLVAKYTGAEAGRRAEKQDKKVEEREIDYFICAGGKASPIRDQYLPGYVPVTSADHYGVTSWYTQQQESERVASPLPFEVKGKDNKDRFDVFQDFRNMVHIDEAFYNNFAAKLTKDEAKKIAQNNAKMLDAKYQDKIGDVLDHFFNDHSVRDILNPQHPFLQTRTFENRGLIYIGMELPENLYRVLNQLNQQLNVVLEGVDSKERKPVVDSIMKEVNIAWFQAVADSYGYGDILTKENIDRKFVARFVVEQNRLDSTFSQITGGNGQKLIVTAAGDAFASPHFMRYSGLTGARENIIHLQQYMQGVNKNPEKQEELLLRLDEVERRTADFVIARGRNFITQLSEEDIRENRQEKMRQSIEEFAKQHANIKIERQDAFHYHLSRGDRSFVISISPEGKIISPSAEVYDSIAQLIYQTI
jgi:hypothetical protein